VVGVHGASEGRIKREDAKMLRSDAKKGEAELSSELRAFASLRLGLCGGLAHGIGDLDEAANGGMHGTSEGGLSAKTLRG
jgi:hypothetical protein